MWWDESSHEDSSVVLYIYLLSMAAEEKTAPLGYINQGQASWDGQGGWGSLLSFLSMWY